jgi:excisionase family DNA binding protein
MVKLATLNTLSELEREMARAGRSGEEEALREALRVLSHSDSEFLTTGQAAELLGVSIPTVKRWVGRGALTGGQVGGRWLVAKESVDYLVSLRESLRELYRQGNPTIEGIRALYALSRPSSERRDATSSEA